MITYYIVLCLHLVCACIWVGGHLVLVTRVLPRALREKKASIIRAFEEPYEQIGMPALGVQIVTGLWLAHRLLGGSIAMWFGDSSISRVVQVKLALLGATFLLALRAKLRVIPRLRDDNIPLLGAHIVTVTVLGVIFVLVGASVRVGGLAAFSS
ncbi:MAG TPA: CopD family protein [Candidatus Didemnitutus sp.]|nr:CopD family protein [Candidatus Didemnitutus sp.]